MRPVTCTASDLVQEQVRRFFRVDADAAHWQRSMRERLDHEQGVREGAVARAAMRAVDREARERAFAIAVRSRTAEQRAKRARVEAIAAADMGGRGAAKVARTL